MRKGAPSETHDEGEDSFEYRPREQGLTTAHGFDSVESWYSSYNRNTSKDSLDGVWRKPTGMVSEHSLREDGTYEVPALLKKVSP